MSLNRSHLYPANPIALALLALAAGLLAACTPSPQARPEESELPPLTLTIVIHAEEDVQGGTRPKPQIPDYDGDEALMLHFSRAMRAFAALARDHGARINFGSDWTFSRAVALYDPTFYVDLEEMGHEIDAHAHESSVLYHEVRELITQAGGHPTHVASGMDERAVQHSLDYFDGYGPEFQVLWGVSLPGHDAGECTAPWVWRPARTDWTVHDPEGAYIYVGHGDALNSPEAIREAVAGRRADRVNTYAVFTSPREFKAAAGTPGIAEQWTAKPESCDYWENRLDWWDEFLTEIDVLVARGDVRYASLTEIADTFAQNEEGLSFDQGQVPRSDEEHRTRRIEASQCP